MARREHLVKLIPDIEYDLPLGNHTEEQLQILIAAGLTCNSCEHRQRWECNSKVFQYCGVRKSNRTNNGLLKIKCKTDACLLYKSCSSRDAAKKSGGIRPQNLTKMTQTNIIGRKTLERINPACFLGDVVRSLSFSPNLRRFIRKHPHFTHVYLDPKDGIWYIGYKDGNIWAGAKFLAALCKGSGTQTFSYPTAISDRFEERTNQFWKCTEYFGRRMFSRWY